MASRLDSPCGNTAKSWQAKKIKNRLLDLDKMIQAIPNPAESSWEEQRKKTEEFYSHLRETWERFVEEKLLNGVVARFQAGVKTQSLKGVGVEDSDYRKVFHAMKKASAFTGHDVAVGRQYSLPTREEMKQDLEELREYEKALRKRQQDLEGKRKLLEEPTTAKGN
jgi:hypothetical protein